MLGVKSTNEPISGKYALQLKNTIAKIFSHPQENKTRGQYNFDWGGVK